MSVVVPTHNEEEGVLGIVTQLRDWLEARGRPYEIVVVDNASEDRTVEVLEPVLDRFQVRLLRNEVNRGKGFSVRRGMLEAKGELRLLCDADCEPSLASLGRMVQAMGDADVVAGSRVVEGAYVAQTQPLRRRLFGWPFIALTRVLMVEPTRDIYCGFKLWRDTAATAVFSRQRLNGWVYDAESLAMARRLGFRVREAGIVWADRKDSRLSIPRVIFPAVRELLRARRNVRSVPRESRPTPPVAMTPAPLVSDSAEPGA
jgi:dolichyl-phosphate beta-glucosyltransferase